MKMTSVTIKNYRSFDEHGDPIAIGEMAAFVGKNSSGKSNILQALQLFWGQISLSPEDFYFGETERSICISITFVVNPMEMLPPLLPYVSAGGLLHLQRVFSESDNKGKLFAFGKKDCSGLGEMNPFPSRKLSSAQTNAFLHSGNATDLLDYANAQGYSIEDSKSFYEILGLYWCDHINEYSGQWIDGAFELDSTTQKAILASLPAYYYLPVSYTAAKLTQDKHSYFQQIYQQILGDVNQLLEGPRVDRLRRQIAAIYRNSGMQKRCSSVNQLLQETGGADASVKMHIELGEPDFSVLFRPSPALLVDDGYDCDVQNKGQGIQRDAIFRLLRVFSQLNRNHQKQFILAIDEPEAFMHPTYKRSLYKSFLELCKVGCQVLYTTHDPAFVSVSRFDDIHTVSMKRTQQQYSTVFSSSFADIMKKEAFRKSCRCSKEEAIRKELEHKCQGEQNEGFFADRVVLVEGATESYALPVYFSRLGYDLDENNTVILRAQSKTLLQLLCSIFSACQIPCYCIFDGDKPKEEVYARFCANQPQDDKECEAFKKLKDRIRLNHALLSMLQGEATDFPKTTINPFYTVWERDFEHAVQMKLSNYDQLKSRITRQEGVSTESKPLVAYHLALKSKIMDFPQEVQELLLTLVQRIQKVDCLPLESTPDHTNNITIHAEETDNAVPVFASAAGRNTYVDDDVPYGYATGEFPSTTSFLVHIQGDSMANQIPDGCYVAVKRIEEWPKPGNIGVFSIDGGEMVCKQYLMLPSGEQQLKSLNPHYPPIVLTEDMRCQVYGEVVMLGKKKPAIFYSEE